jgi:hypothetical protein
MLVMGQIRGAEAGWGAKHPGGRPRSESVTTGLDWVGPGEETRRFRPCLRSFSTELRGPWLREYVAGAGGLDPEVRPVSFT